MGTESICFLCMRFSNPAFLLAPSLHLGFAYFASPPLESGQRCGCCDWLSAPEGAAKVCDEHLSAACAPCHGSAGAEQSLFVPLMSSSAGSSLQRFSQGSVPTVLSAAAHWMQAAFIV